jgi:acyl-CoA thioesterase FadM
MGGASFTIRQEVYRTMSGSNPPSKLAVADVRLACIDAALQPARLPQALKTALSHTKAIEE